MTTKQIRDYFTTRRIYGISSAFFVLWMIFFDGDNMLKQWELYNEYRELRAERDFLQGELTRNQVRKEELSQPGALERYARETYYFHKEDEEVIAIEFPEDQEDTPVLFQH